MCDKNNKDIGEERAYFSGRWTREEEEYTDCLINEFRAGNLPNAAEGATLRNFLAEAVSCHPKRISKKYEGTDYNGRQQYWENIESLSEDEKKERLKRLEKLKQCFERSRQRNLTRAGRKKERRKKSMRPMLVMPGTKRKARGKEEAEQPSESNSTSNDPADYPETNFPDTLPSLARTQPGQLGLSSSGQEGRLPLISGAGLLGVDVVPPLPRRLPQLANPPSQPASAVFSLPVAEQQVLAGVRLGQSHLSGLGSGGAAIAGRSSLGAAELSRLLHPTSTFDVPSSGGQYGPLMGRVLTSPNTKVAATLSAMRLRTAMPSRVSSSSPLLEHARNALNNEELRRRGNRLLIDTLTASRRSEERDQANKRPRVDP